MVGLLGGGCGRGLGELGPDVLPVIRAQVLTADFAKSGALDLNATMYGHYFFPRNPIRHYGRGNAQGSRNDE